MGHPPPTRGWTKAWPTFLLRICVAAILSPLVYLPEPCKDFSPFLPGFSGRRMCFSIEKPRISIDIHPSVNDILQTFGPLLHGVPEIPKTESYEPLQEAFSDRVHAALHVRLTGRELPSDYLGKGCTPRADAMFWCYYPLPGKVSSATPDLSSSPFPSSIIRSNCFFVALANGRLRPAWSANDNAIPESLEACADEK